MAILWLPVLNGEFTVKFLRKMNMSAGWSRQMVYPEIKISEDMDMQVWGVVTCIITDTQRFAKCRDEGALG
jgi:hypothetical protein